MARVRGFGMIAVAGAIAALTMLATCAPAPRRAVPPGYPAAYADTLDAADREGHLLVWAAIDAGKAAGLLADFRQRHPRIAVDYVEMPAAMLNRRFLEAAAHHRPLPDFLWSSAMDLQIKLTNDGYAQPYVSPEAAHLPHWANWKDEAWGTTAEPIVLLYNRRLVADAAVPHTHDALATLLDRRRVGPWIATYDVPRSAVGYLYLSQDAQAWGGFWRLAAAMGAGHAHLFTRAEDLLHAVAGGEAAFGYDVVGSYALAAAARDPRLGVALFSDYTLLMSRIALIPAGAPHPAAARLFVDHLLSRAGQALLAAQDIPSVRADVAPVDGLAPGTIPVRAIRVGPGLLVTNDRLTQRHFLKRWTAALRD